MLLEPAVNCLTVGTRPDLFVLALLILPCIGIGVRSPVLLPRKRHALIYTLVPAVEVIVIEAGERPRVFSFPQTGHLPPSTYPFCLTAGRFLWPC